VSEVPYRIIIVEFLNFILDIEFPPSRHWWTHNCEKLVDISDPQVSLNLTLLRIRVIRVIGLLLFLLMVHVCVSL
jgi:hypothetical protein